MELSTSGPNKHSIHRNGNFYRVLVDTCSFQFRDQKAETQTGWVISLLPHSQSMARPNFKYACLALGSYTNCVIKRTWVDRVGLNTVSTADLLTLWLWTSYVLFLPTHFLLYEMEIMTVCLLEVVRNRDHVHRLDNYVHVFSTVCWHGGKFANVIVRLVMSSCSREAELSLYHVISHWLFATDCWWNFGKFIYLPRVSVSSSLRLG